MQQTSHVPLAWIPVMCGLLVISLESTQVMGSGHTSQWLLQACSSLWGQTDSATFETVHFYLRKTGHFNGYGLLALLFAKAWTLTLSNAKSLRRRMRMMVGAAAGVLSAAAVACADEIHQLSLPGRTGTFHDVCIDTCGALLYVGTFYAISRRRYNELRRMRAA